MKKFLDFVILVNLVSCVLNVGVFLVYHEGSNLVMALVNFGLVNFFYSKKKELHD